MPRKPNYQAKLDDAVGRAVDVGLDALFDRATEFFQRGMEQQRSAMQQVPPELRRSAYKCSGCHNMFPFEGLAMISAKGDGFGTCERCFRFMWHAANEKILALKQGVGDFARSAGAPRSRQPAGAEPPGPKPWEVLGVDPNASIEDIKKAYRKLAGAAHPDRVPPGSPSEVVEAARARFEEIDRAYKVMMKVRSPAT